MNSQDSIHLDILKRIFKERRNKNPKYSLRAFAKDLQLNPSTLSDILKKRRNVSEKLGRGIAFHLGLQGKEKSVFLTSVLEGRSRSSRIKKQHHDKLTTLMNQKPSYLLDAQEMIQINSWVYFAIIELMTFSDYDFTSLWIAKKLKMDEFAVQSHLAALFSLGWVEKNEKGFVPKVLSAECANDFPSEAMRKYHKTVLANSMRTLDQSPVEAREFQSAVFSFDRKQTGEAKRFIRDFVEQFCLKFNAVEAAQRNDVRQLAVQFYSLTEESPC